MSSSSGTFQAGNASLIVLLLEVNHLILQDFKPYLFQKKPSTLY